MVSQETKGLAFELLEENFIALLGLLSSGFLLQNEVVLENRLVDEPASCFAAVLAIEELVAVLVC